MSIDDDSWKIDAFVDGELDLASRLEMERRLAHDDALRRRVDSLRSLGEAVRENADRHRAPEALRERTAAWLQAARPQAAPVDGAAGSAASPRARSLSGWFDWLGWRPLVVATAFAAVLAVALDVVMQQTAREDRLMNEAIASHVRSTIGPHLVDVASSERHTVKPFLSSKLGFSPPVAELPLPGSTFVGGRVDYFDGRPVAALVYRQGEHVVNSFVWPDAAKDSQPEFATERGYRIAHWSQDGMHHCVISDVNHQEFQRLVDAVRAAAAAG